MSAAVSNNPPVRTALIVGAGPAGLSAAISLRQNGVESVKVVEAQAQRGALGSELSVSSPMLRALDQIGVAHAVADAGVAIEEARLCGPDGSVFAEIPFPRVAGPDLPGTVGIGRARLYEVLWDAAEKVGAELSLGRCVSVVSQDADGVQVTFTDGAVETYDLVVGADGVRSTVRKMTLADAPEPTYSGQIAWRARVPRHTDAALALFHLPDRKAGLITVAPTDSYLFLLVNAAEPGRPDRADFPKLLQEALAGFGGEIAEIRDEITDPSTIHYSPLTPLLVPGPWHKGRVILIGDAVHATTPHLAYGAGLGVEDGVILGEELGKASDLEAALTSFTERRWERCRMVVENGLQIQRWEIDGVVGPEAGALTAQSQMALAEQA